MMNTIDLTGLFLQAYERKDKWSEAMLVSTLHQLSVVFPFASLDWDQDAGECWVRFLRKNEVFIYVRVDMPVVIILSTYASKIESILSRWIVIISVPDMDAQLFFLDRSKIGQFFPDTIWSSEVDPSLFSIDELWYTTVT